MSQLHAPICPFDAWKDGKNDQLRGGEVISVLKHRFAYRYLDDGRVWRTLVTGKAHGETIAELLTRHVDEMAILLPLAIDVLGDVESYNVYASEGRVAGALISGHAHLNIIPRYPDEPAAEMGLEKLIHEYNATILRYMWSGGT